jgi:hypothetical protein
MLLEYIFTEKQTNIYNFIKKYKNKTFILKNDSMEFEVKLHKIKSLINSKLDYYIINTIENGFDIEHIKHVFRIDFFYKKPSFENVYIYNISKSIKYSGSNVVNFVIDFLKSFIQVKYIYLYDDTKVNCKDSNDKFDLSLYKLLTSNIGFYQKLGFKLIIENNKKDITKTMIQLAKKVGNYKIKNILQNLKDIINLVEKYTNKIQVSYIEKYDKIIIEKKLEDYKNFIYNIGYLYFIMISYKNYTFQKYILTLNNKKCFILSQLFEILNYILYFEFSYEKEKIKSPFFLDYIKLVIYRTHYQWKGIFMKSLIK